MMAGSVVVYCAALSASSDNSASSEKCENKPSEVKGARFGDDATDRGRGEKDQTVASAKEHLYLPLWRLLLLLLLLLQMLPTLAEPRFITLDGEQPRSMAGCG